MVFSVDSQTKSQQNLKILDLLHSLADRQDLLNQKAEARAQGSCGYVINLSVSIRH